MYDLVGLFFKAPHLTLKQKTNLKSFNAPCKFVFCVCSDLGLLALVSVLSQSFFTLVRRHFMSFFLFSARHG